MHRVPRVALTLIACLSVHHFSRVVVAQEGDRPQHVGRVPGTSGANAAPATSVAESQDNHQTDSDLPSRDTAQVPGRADDTGDPVLRRDRHPLYRLRIGDVVDIAFAFSPELNQTVAIGPDGYVALKNAGPLYAEGETLPRLESGIAKSYAGILHEPQITVTLKDFERPYYLALGQVARPGKYELRAPLTVTQALAVSGGLSQQARHSEVVLFRRVSDEWVETRVLDVKRMLNSRNLQEDLLVHTGDLLFVPQSTISKIQRFMPSTAVSTYVNPTQF